MPGPLDGLVVLDCTHALAGPFCGLILADLGADVIKVENTDAEGRLRGGGHPFVAGQDGQMESGQLLIVNRNKRGIAIDLKNLEGRAAFHRLVEHADVIVQNFRPGTMERLGCGYEALRDLNPRLIYCSVSGFGQTGPYKDRAGLDLITQGMSGLMSITGEPDREPAKAGLPVCDVGTGMYGVIGILASVIERERTGLGQQIDVCLMDTPISWMVWEAAQYFAHGEVPGPLGSGHRLGVPYRAYQGSDGAWLTIGASSNKAYAHVCAVLGQPELATDARFDTGEKRRHRRSELTGILRALFKMQTAEHWIEELVAAGVPCGPINSIDWILDHEPHVKERNLVVETDHPVVGKTRALATPIKLSRTPVEVVRPAPRHGEHTGGVLRWAGLSQSEISHLASSGAIRALDVPPIVEAEAATTTG